MSGLKYKIVKPAVEIVKSENKTSEIGDKEALMALVEVVKEVGIECAKAAIRMGKFDVEKFADMELKEFNALCGSLPCKHRKGKSLADMTCAGRISLGIDPVITSDVCKTNCVLRSTN